MIDIKFKYKLIKDETWHTLSITPEEYIDYDYFDEGEEVIVSNIICRYDDYRKFLSENEISNVVALQLEKSDVGYLAKKRVLKEFFWNNQKNSLIETICTEIDKYKKEIIIASEFKLNKNDTLHETLRISRINGVLKPNLVAYFKYDIDGIDSQYGKYYTLEK